MIDLFGKFDGTVEVRQSNGDGTFHRTVFEPEDALPDTFAEDRGLRLDDVVKEAVRKSIEDWRTPERLALRAELISEGDALKTTAKTQATILSLELPDAPKRSILGVLTFGLFE